MNVYLLYKSAKLNFDFFRLFLLGFHPQLANLYPSVAYPLSRETPMISPLVKWNHDLEWHVTSFRSQEKIRSGGRNVIIDVKNESYLYVAGHVIDGRNLFPATGYLVGSNPIIKVVFL